jgi:hypothetical protein
MFGLGLIPLGHNEPVKGLKVQAHHPTILDMNCIVLWPVWPPRTINVVVTTRIDPNFAQNVHIYQKDGKGCKSCLFTHVHSIISEQR